MITTILVWLSAFKDIIAIAVSTGFAGGMIAAWRSYRRRTRESTAMLTGLRDSVAELKPLMESVQYELKANGGGSLKDAIISMRNEQAVERVARRMMSNAAVLEVACRPDGSSVVLFASHAYIRLTGLTRDDCEHDGWVRAIHSADRDRVSKISRIAHDEGVVISTTYRIVHIHTGAVARVEHTGTPVLNYKSEVVGWVYVLIPTAAESA